MTINGKKEFDPERQRELYGNSRVSEFTAYMQCKNKCQGDKVLIKR